MRIEGKKLTATLARSLASSPSPERIDARVLKESPLEKSILLLTDFARDLA
jgi:hypothetical protein